MPPCSKHLQSAEKALILAVRDFFNREKQQGGPFEFHNVIRDCYSSKSLHGYCEQNSKGLETAGKGCKPKKAWKRGGITSNVRHRQLHGRWDQT